MSRSHTSAGRRPGVTRRDPARQRHKGVTLLVVLMILAVVTVLGLGGAQMALLGTRTSRFERDQQIAMQAAEFALADARQDIFGPSTSTARAALLLPDNRMGFESGCGNTTLNRGLCAASAAGTKAVWASVNFLESGTDAHSVQAGTYTGRSFDAGDTGVRPARAPRYVIEAYEEKALGEDQALGKPSNSQVIYRVTAMGFGPREEAQVVLQAEFRKVQE